MTIETHFDVSLVAGLALREKQVQQAYRPIIAVHKWFARRPGTLFRALLLAEFGDAPLHELFFQGNDLSGHRIADPFMGGGTTLLEANRMGCDVVGFDINPMSTWIVREEIEEINLDAYAEASTQLVDRLAYDIGEHYLTDCPLYGDLGVPVKYFLWVKTLDCESCGRQVDLFPGYVLAKDTRHPKNVLVCPTCGELNEIQDRVNPGTCRDCDAHLQIDGPARRGNCVCPHCNHNNRYPQAASGPPSHRLFAIEYHNPGRKKEHLGRFFKKPDASDLARYTIASERLSQLPLDFVPTDKIPTGDETTRLHRWGYRYYRHLFNDRQLLGLERSCQFIRDVADQRLRHALATNLSDLLRYQNMLCRYDTWALKSLDIFSVHGFPVGLIQCESNLLGIPSGRSTNIGSGGWTNITAKYTKAKRYCSAPFEVRRVGSRNRQIPVRGEWIGEHDPMAQELRCNKQRIVSLNCKDAATVSLPPRSLDAVFTDPPYFANVQYGELMDFCYVWLRRLVGTKAEGFTRETTRHSEELTGNDTQSRGLDHFTEGLAKVYRRMAEALKPGAPLAFTYHHNAIDAYYPVGVAILDAGLTCTAALPCPAEMSGSIHIRGTYSSIVDTVFVCRQAGLTPTPASLATGRGPVPKQTNDLVSIIMGDIDLLSKAGHKATKGDIRCIAFGHLTRMAVLSLVTAWDSALPASDKLARFGKAVAQIADPVKTLEELMDREPAAACSIQESDPLR